MLNRTDRQDISTQASSTPRDVTPHKGGIIQTFGLDVRVAILAVLVDVLAFSGDVISAGLLYPVELISAVILAVITYKIQKHWYGDDHHSALIKALLIGLITAIPVPISPLFTGPAGLLGLVRALVGKK